MKNSGFGIESAADSIFWIDETDDLFAPILVTVASHLFAYHIAKIKKCAIDQPRNLAKSVTVE